MILLASGISAPFGSLFYGWLADKIGRRKVMILTVLELFGCHRRDGADARRRHGSTLFSAASSSASA